MPSSVVAQVHPHPPGRGLARAGRLHRDGRVVGVELGAGHDMGGDVGYQWLQEPADLAQPVSQRRAAELDAVAGVDLRQALGSGLITSN